MTATGIKRFAPRFSLRTLVVFLLLVTSGAGALREYVRDPWRWECVSQGNDRHVRGMVASSNGRRLVAWDGPSCRVWDLETSDRPHVLTGNGYYAPAVSRDCTRMAVHDEGLLALRVVSTCNGEDIGKRLPWPVGRPVGFSPDGEFLVAHCQGDGEGPHVQEVLAVLGTRPLTEIYRLPWGKTHTLQGVAFSPDSKLLAVLDWEGAARVLEVPSGQERLRLRSETGGMLSVAFSPDGLRTVTAHGGGATVVWDALTGKRTLVLSHQMSNVDEHYSLFADNGRLVVSASHYGVAASDADTGATFCSFGPARGAGPQSFRDRRGCMVLNDKACVVDLRTGYVLSELTSPIGLAVAGAIFSGDGTRIFARAWARGFWKGGPIVVFRRRRPEWWWGVFWLWEFWLTVLFAGVFVWSVWRDRRVFRHPPSPQPSPPVSGGEGDSGAAKGGDA